MNTDNDDSLSGGYYVSPARKRAERLALGGILALLLLGALTLALTGCGYVSLYTAELWTAQHAAALRCRADKSACAAAHVCADAAIKASRALAELSKAREAEAAARARGGPAVDLVALAEQERTALALKEQGLKACEASPQVPPASQPSAPPEACADNLCGGPATESICSCHGEGELRRCWSTVQRCQQDAACCSARGDCKGTAAGEDTCSRQVRALSLDPVDAGVADAG